VRVTLRLLAAIWIGIFLIVGHSRLSMSGRSASGS